MFLTSKGLAMLYGSKLINNKSHVVKQCTKKSEILIKTALEIEEHTKIITNID